MVDPMGWPAELRPDRYPGTVRREITVETNVDDGRLVFTAVLRDRWIDGAADQESRREEEIHGYEVRLVAEPPDLTVVSVHVRPRFLPFPECPAAAGAAQRLVGLRLTRGFRPAATEILGGVEGCTHLLTLVLNIWNHQVVSQYMLTRVDGGTEAGGPMDFEQVVNVCSGWREGGLGIRLARAGRPFPPHVDYGTAERPPTT
jgi:hypothetical protein